MGFSIYYRSATPVKEELDKLVREDVRLLSKGRSWLSCEPVSFYRRDHGEYLQGGSKPNFQPQRQDVETDAGKNQPDGTLRDVLDVLCKLSLDHQINWELSHDYNSAMGSIHIGVCDDSVLAEVQEILVAVEMMAKMEAL